MAHMKVDRNFKVTIVLDPGDEGYEAECTCTAKHLFAFGCSCVADITPKFDLPSDPDNDVMDELEEKAERTQAAHDEAHRRFDKECERKGI